MLQVMPPPSSPHLSPLPPAVSCLHSMHDSFLMMASANILSSARGDREDDGTEPIESDSPSDLTTPQPDPSDKRLPGILHNSYFGQVGSGSPISPPSSGRS